MTVDPLHPPASLLVKLGSIIVHADEALGPGGHHFDVQTMQTLLEDPEVERWLAEMDVLALLPKKRSDSYQERDPAREPDPTEGLPLELVRVLRDPTITISRDHEIRLADGRTLFEHIEEWRNAPSDTASASLPAMSQDDAWEKRSHER